MFRKFQRWAFIRKSILEFLVFIRATSKQERKEKSVLSHLLRLNKLRPVLRVVILCVLSCTFCSMAQIDPPI